MAQPLGRLKFRFTIVPAGSAQLPAEPLGADAKAYTRPYLCFADPDREAVLRVARMMDGAGQKLDPEIFSLTAAQRWER